MVASPNLVALGGEGSLISMGLSTSGPIAPVALWIVSRRRTTFSRDLCGRVRVVKIM
jgi:hypothetical protein